MDATKWFVTNRRSRFNPLLDKANRTMPQYTFDDIVDCMEDYHQAKSKEQQPEVSDERIEDLWYNHAGAEHNGGLLNLMTREDFEAALKKLNK